MLGGQRRGLFKRPALDGSSDEDDEAVRAVKNKPIASQIARKLDSNYRHSARQFVTASAKSQKDFYGNQSVVTSTAGEIEEGGSDSGGVEEMRAMTSGERNKLSAKILKCELSGNLKAAARLRKQLESGVVEAKRKEDSSQSNTTILMTKTDFRSSVTRPLRKSDMEVGESETCSLHELMEAERLTTADDYLEAVVSCASTSSAAQQKTDDDFTVDDIILTEKEKQKRRKKVEKLERKQQERAVKAQKRFEETLDNCVYCIESRKLCKQTIVATGFQTYLCVPAVASLVEGHCYIVPMMHASSSLQMDEDVFDEMMIWRKGLTAMFADRGDDAVFLETARNVRHQPHALVECIPVPKEVGETLPIYFKKALSESEHEWSQNKKVINLAEKGSIRRSIPKGFSYFAVDFGLQAGYAHVIEDEQLFLSNFGKEVIGGVLDLSHNLWKKPALESLEEQVKKASRLKKFWQPYDWTARAKGQIAHEKEGKSNSPDEKLENSDKQKA